MLPIKQHFVGGVGNATEKKVPKKTKIKKGKRKQKPSAKPPTESVEIIPVITKQNRSHPQINATATVASATVIAPDKNLTRKHK